MSNSRYRRHVALLFLLVATAVASGKKTASSSLRRYLKRKSASQQGNAGKNRIPAENVPFMLPSTTTTQTVKDSSRDLTLDLVGGYLKRDHSSNSSSNSGAPIAEQGAHQNGRDLRRRKRTFRNYGKGKGGYKSSKGGSSKGSKGSNGAKGAKYGDDGRGISSKGLKGICRDLDFRSFYGYGYGNSGKGQKGDGGFYLFGKGGKRQRQRRLETNARTLQFEGELCAPNIFDVASLNPELSIFADLLQAANLDDIFFCAGKLLPSIIRFCSSALLNHC